MSEEWGGEADRNWNGSKTKAGKVERRGEGEGEGKGKKVMKE